MSSLEYAVFLVIVAGATMAIAEEEPFALPIIGGETSPVSDFPFLVSLSTDEGSWWDSFCGASIINESFILTAAHCSPEETDVKLQDMRVVAGLYDLTDKKRGQWKTLVNFIIHPRYSESVFALYDIAVVRLSSPLTLKTREVEKATLNTDSSCPEVGAQCSNTGWGQTSPQPGSGSNVRKKCALNVRNLEECGKEVSTVGSICAGNPIGGEGSCKGDSGGPLISRCGGRQTVVGVVSCGTKGCDTSYPAVYTRVSFFQKWIATGDTSEVIPGEPGGGGPSGGTYSGSSSGLNCGFHLLLIFALLVPNIF